MIQAAKLQNWIPLLRPFFAPPTCELCQTLVTQAPALCAHCEKLFRRLNDSHCEICALPFEGEGLSLHHCGECLSKTPSFEKVSSPYEFEGTATELIHAAKFRKQVQSLKILSGYSAEFFKECVEEFRPDYLLPMPLSWRRRFMRGFNQSYLLAENLKRDAEVQIPIYHRVLRKHTPPQAKKSREERLRSLKGVFRLPLHHPLKDAKVLIVDDVLTTGATAQALSRVLMKAGVKVVQVFVIARVRKGK